MLLFTTTADVRIITVPSNGGSVCYIIYYLSNTLLSSNESIFVETVPVVLERFAGP